MRIATRTADIQTDDTAMRQEAYNRARRLVEHRVRRG